MSFRDISMATHALKSQRLIVFCQRPATRTENLERPRRLALCEGFHFSAAQHSDCCACRKETLSCLSQPVIQLLVQCDMTTGDNEGMLIHSLSRQPDIISILSKSATSRAMGFLLFINMFGLISFFITP